MLPFGKVTDPWKITIFNRQIIELNGPHPGLNRPIFRCFFAGYIRQIRNVHVCPAGGNLVHPYWGMVINT
jgi:hypothetical protein